MLQLPRRTLNRFVSFAGPWLTAALCGCTDAPHALPVEVQQGPVVNGMLSVASDDAVVNVRSNIGTFAVNCTGTAIAPNVVLTAAHCVSESDPSAPFTCSPEGTIASGSGGKLGPLLDPKFIRIYTGVSYDGPEYAVRELFGTGTPNSCRDDIAILVLEENIDIGDAPLIPLRFDRSTQAGELTRAVGYGSSNTGLFGRQTRENIVVRGVGAPNSSTEGDPGVAPRTLTIGEGPCHGDSGGPLLSMETGAQIGVYSLLVSQSCVGPDAKSVLTQVAPFKALIRQVLSAEGHEPLVEPPSEETGGTGGGTGAAGETGEGGEPGFSGAPGEGGAPVGAAGQSSGASPATGGDGGTGGSGAASAASTGNEGSGADGTGATSGAGTQSRGSGSRRDPGCGCHTVGTAENGPGALALLFMTALGLGFLRRASVRDDPSA